jgi:hypothetical protein
VKHIYFMAPIIAAMLLVAWWAKQMPTHRHTAASVETALLPHSDLTFADSKAKSATRKADIGSTVQPAARTGNIPQGTGTAAEQSSSPSCSVHIPSSWEYMQAHDRSRMFLTAYRRCYDNHSDRMLHAIETLYAAEPRDDAWANDVEARVKEAAAQTQGLTLMEGDCRTSLCRYVLSLSHPVNQGIALSDFHQQLVKHTEKSSGDVIIAHKLPNSSREGFDLLDSSPPTVMSIANGEDTLYLFRATSPAAYVESLPKLLEGQSNSDVH